MSRESAKQAGRHWLIEALDNRVKGIDLIDGQRTAFEDQWYVPETDENGIWKCGWLEHGIYLKKPREKLLENLTVTLVGRILETTSDGADGADGKDKGKDKG